MQIGLVEIEGFAIVVAGICAAIVLIGNVIKTLKGAAKPAKDLLDRIDDLERKVASDWDFRQEQEDFNKIMLKSMRQLIRQQLGEVDKESLKKVENEIDEFLVDHV